MDLRDLTTLRLGGPARELVTARTQDELVQAVQAAQSPVLVLGGGSNVVAPDAGFPGTVVLVRTTGIERDGSILHVAAGEDWDTFVATCVAEGLSGVECLSGIPGSVGATPIQNVGAYGQEVAQTIAGVRVLEAGEIRDLGPEECGFAYRSSAFKREPGRRVVLRVSFRLEPSPLAQPIAYPELARAAGVELGARPPLGAVREAVLALRRGKGMVLDPADPDTTSAGSFFTNPVLDAAAFEALRERADSEPPGWPEPGGLVKTSAAWLIQNAGFSGGYGDPEGIAISSKHVLALTNRGSGTTAELLALAAELQDGVRERFGVQLVPEPVVLDPS